MFAALLGFGKPGQTWGPRLGESRGWAWGDPVVGMRGAGIAPCCGRERVARKGLPQHHHCHTRFPAASQPFCSPSSIYLIINSAITINSWGCCSHVDQSSAVVRAEQGHVSGPGGLLSPGINCSGRVCRGCAGLWSPRTGGCSSPSPVATAQAPGAAATGTKHPSLQYFVPVAVRTSCSLEIRRRSRAF